MKRVLKNFGTMALIGVLCVAFGTMAQAQTVINGKSAVGTWKTIDDETGDPKSHIQISESGGTYSGKIIKLLKIAPDVAKQSKVGAAGGYSDLTCTTCPAAHGKDQKMIGLKMLWGMKKEGNNRYAQGEIMDPKKGKVYTCTMWLDDSDSSGNTLKVRGWWGFFYRTQTWHRVN